MELFLSFWFGKTIDRKAKFKHLNGVFKLLLFFGILKICGFAYFYIVGKIVAKQANMFC